MNRLPLDLVIVTTWSANLSSQLTKCSCRSLVSEEEYHIHTFWIFHFTTYLGASATAVFWSSPGCCSEHREDSIKVTAQVILRKAGLRT